MKKFKFLSAMAALLVAGAMVSCTSSDDPVIKPIVTGLTTGEITYKVTVTSNVETKFTFNGETKTGKTAEFEVNASNYKLLIALVRKMRKWLSLQKSRLLSLSLTL